MFCHALLSAGVLNALVGCAGSKGSSHNEHPEPTYQTPPLPDWSAAPTEPSSIDPAILDGEEVVDQPPSLDDQSGIAAHGETQTPQKPVELEKSVDVVPEAGQNSSTAPSARGTVAPP